jgi:hypothetical protein
MAIVQTRGQIRNDQNEALAVLSQQVRAQHQRPVAIWVVGWGWCSELGATLGYYETDLRDGTLGYSMRRADDCFQACIATCLQVPSPNVPDVRLDAKLAAGKDPEEIGRFAWGTMIQWSARRGLTVVIHPRPPTSERRWIGVVPDRGTFNGHCLVMCKSEVLHNPMTVTPGDPGPHDPGDIDFGITFERI